MAANLGHAGESNSTLPHSIHGHFDDVSSGETWLVMEMGLCWDEMGFHFLVYTSLLVSSWCADTMECALSNNVIMLPLHSQLILCTVQFRPPGFSISARNGFPQNDHRNKSGAWTEFTNLPDTTSVSPPVSLPTGWGDLCHTCTEEDSQSSRCAFGTGMLLVSWEWPGFRGGLWMTLSIFFRDLLGYSWKTTIQ